MKSLTLGVFFLSIGLSAFSSAQADEVVSEVHDNTAGKTFGTLGGLMVGGAAGGPIGALAGAGLGWLSGWGIQDSTGLSEKAYKVRTNTGETLTVRSPRQRFAVGEQVEYRAGRLHSTVNTEN
ncbi:hypothetical protein [Pseudomonas luteola]|uniref:hypothetical protein n=1 Tax=Pseudomonas TaxID=286 RepID=UPI00388EF80D